MSGLSNNANAEPDLTPILDMVFQLITFFMLVTNFKANAMDLNLKLPVLGSARPVDEGEENDSLLVLNVNNKGRMTVFNQAMEPERYLQAAAEQELITYRKVKPDAVLGDELPTIVVIRADKGTPFGMINKVIKACQKNGYRRFALRAMNKEG